MSWTQWLGATILGVVFGAFFVASARMAGWGVAVMVWLGSLAITGIIILGVFLLTGGA